MASGAHGENSSLFLNRELSWLAFNRRVLEEALDAGNPLLERVKLLAITASNLDEFFEIRVAGLLQRLEDGAVEAGPDGLPPRLLRDRIVEETHAFSAAQYRAWNEVLRPALAEEAVVVRSAGELDAAQRRFVDQYYQRELDPLLTPITIDPAHPFPRVLNKALALAVWLRRRRKGVPPLLGVVTVPRALPRLIPLPTQEGRTEYLFLADLVADLAARLYRGYQVEALAGFRVTRNSNLYLQEEESRNLLESVRTELHHRRQGNAVRLEIDADAPAEIVERLCLNFELQDWQVYPAPGPVNLSRLMELYERSDSERLKFRRFVPRELVLAAPPAPAAKIALPARPAPPREEILESPAPAPVGIFDELRRHDVLLHHPFDSFDPVVSFVETAVGDPRVLSIRQTLYRTNRDSPIVQALLDAASQKEVVAVIEVKARFDEAHNIRWARNLEDAGVQVFHGLVGLKTHCKLSLVVRQDPDGVLRRYAHLGTGNYNPETARFYTDLSLLTADPELTRAVQEIFRYLTAYAERPQAEPLLVAPLNLANKLRRLIERESEHARQGLPARIVMKINGLLDVEIVQALYAASQAGVEIDLIVRGICSLRPGVRGLSERIRVRSVVGRMLEHSRIFYFGNGGVEEVYLGSADLMPRNLRERVEVVFPLRDVHLRARVYDEILRAYLADTAKAWQLHPDGSYTRIVPARGAAPFNCQEFFIALAEGRVTAADIPAPAAPLGRVPRPRRRGAQAKAKAKARGGRRSQ